MRPAPLHTAPELVTLLDHRTNAFTVEGLPHGEYLRQHVSGDVLIVARDDDRRNRFATFSRNAPAVESITTVKNDTHNSQTVRDHDPAIPTDQQFDTIIYTKEATAWFARSRDFHRFTEDRLALGGTLLGKTKWIPDSNRIELVEIALVNPLGFTPPNVYLRWEKVQSQQTLTNIAAETAADGGSVASSDNTSPVCELSPTIRHQDNQSLITQSKQLESQFNTDAIKTTFTPGWSWHTSLIEHVRDRIASINGTVVNLCCGSNSLGDIRVDRLREYETIVPDADSDSKTIPTAVSVQADGMTVPLATNSVSAVITDPPWKVPITQRIKLFSEAVRIVEPGGRVIVNAWWLPDHPYVTVAELVRAVTANVNDNSLDGPGGISFLTEYEVAEHPAHNWCEYTLTDHMERVGVEGLQRYFNTTNHAPCPLDDPRRDPRIFAGPTTGCETCNCDSYGIRTVRGTPLYECYNCGFRHSVGELLE